MRYCLVLVMIFMWHWGIAQAGSPMQATDPNISESDKKTAPAFFVEVSSGVKIGWWMINNGSDNVALENNLGYDYSHLSAFVPASLNLGLETQYFRAGMSASFQTFFETSMRRQIFRSVADRSYNIAESNVQIIQLGLLATYKIKNSRMYTLAFYADAGVFWEDSNHPARDNFGSKYYWTIGADNTLKISENLSLNLRPVMQNSRIILKTKSSPNNRHRIFNLGADIGMQYNFRRRAS